MVGCAIIKYPSVLVMSTVGNEVTAKLAPSLGVTPKEANIAISVVLKNPLQKAGANKASSFL